MTYGQVPVQEVRKANVEIASHQVAEESVAEEVQRASLTRDEDLLVSDLADSRKRRQSAGIDPNGRRAPVAGDCEADLHSRG